MSQLVALHNVQKKSTRLAEVQAQALKARAKHVAKEKQAREDLEDVVNFVLSTKQISMNALARDMNCSADKLRGMVKRSNERSRERMSK